MAAGVQSATQELAHFGSKNRAEDPQSVVQNNKPTSRGGVGCSEKEFSIHTVRSQKSAHRFGLISVVRTQGLRHCLRGGIYFSRGHSACSKAGCSAPRCMVLPPPFFAGRSQREHEGLSLISSDALKMKKKWQPDGSGKQGGRAGLLIPSVGWVSLVWGSPQYLCRHLIVATAQDQHTPRLQYHTSASRKALYHDSDSSLVTVSSSASKGRKSWAKITPYLLSAPVIDHPVCNKEWWTTSVWKAGINIILINVLFRK